MDAFEPAIAALDEPRPDDPQKIGYERDRIAQNLVLWDRHVDRCSECLSRGVELCPEGEYIATRVQVARSQLAKLVAKHFLANPPATPVLRAPRALAEAHALLARERGV